MPATRKIEYIDDAHYLYRRGLHYRLMASELEGPISGGYERLATTLGHG